MSPSVTHPDATSEWLTAARKLARNADRMPDVTLPTAFHSDYESTVLRPLVSIVRHQSSQSVAVAGPAGAGKSTLVKAIADYFRHTGTTVAIASLDDFYYPRAKRTKLGYEFRAAPGTHDIARLQALLRDARAGRVPLVIPRFDPAIDDAGEPEVLHTPPALVLIDGWFLGLSSLGYETLLPEFDLIVHLRIPEDVARQRRFAREADLRTRTGEGYSVDQMERFWRDVLGPGGASWVADAEAHADLVMSFRPDGALDQVLLNPLLLDAIRS